MTTTTSRDANQRLALTSCGGPGTYSLPVIATPGEGRQKPAPGTERAPTIRFARDTVHDVAARYETAISRS
jgi:hypothetical protein